MKTTSVERNWKPISLFYWFVLNDWQQRARVWVRQIYLYLFVVSLLCPPPVGITGSRAAQRGRNPGYSVPARNVMSLRIKWLRAPALLQTPTEHIDGGAQRSSSTQDDSLTYFRCHTAHALHRRRKINQWRCVALTCLFSYEIEKWFRLHSWHHEMTWNTRRHSCQ